MSDNQATTKRTTATQKTSDKSGGQGERRPWMCKQQQSKGRQEKVKNPEEVPILKFGPNNNFAKFKEALSNKALREFGDLGRLIETGEYYAPEPPDLGDYDLINDPHGINKATYLEHQKLYMKHWEDMQNNRAKLFALIIQYLSQESLAEVRRQPDFDLIKANRDVQSLWHMVQDIHKVFTASRIAAVVKKTARKDYQTIHQGPYENIITYKERFDVALTAYQDQDNAQLAEPDIAMDFFDGLDNARYSEFKKSLLNGITLGSVTQPATLNAMYLLANQWIKSAAPIQSGLASTFVTKINVPDLMQTPAGKDKQASVDQSQVGDNKDKPTDSEPKKRDMSKVKCFRCHKKGHIAPNCPEKQEEEASSKTFSIWEPDDVGSYVTYRVCESANQKRKFDDYDILLDNQADVSIVHPRMLREIMPAESPVIVQGIGGKQLTLSNTGYLDEFFRVYASDQARPSILSLADVEDLHRVTYYPGQAFVVHLPNQDLEFVRTGKLYLASYKDIIDPSVHVYATVEENESIYTRKEIRKAREAYEFLKCSGYPSPEEAMHLLQDGNIVAVPDITTEDITRAYDIYGLPAPYVRGKTVRRVITRTPVDLSIIMKDKVQALYADVMHIDGSKFLISVVEPLQLTIQAYIENETANELGLGLQGHLSLLRSRGFQPTIVYVDPQSGFRALKNMFPGVVVDDCGASDYVPKVDAKIKRIKETYHAVKHGLPWKLPAALVKHLVCYAVGRINIRRTSALQTNLSPFCIYTGMKVNYRKSLALGFGDYCEVFDGSDNTSKPRTIPCIALHPCNNSTGSWEFLNLLSGMRVRRSNWRRMVTTQLIVDKMNAMPGLQTELEEEPLVPPLSGQGSDHLEVAQVERERDDVQSQSNVNETNVEDDNDLNVVDEDVVVDQPDRQQLRRSARIARGVAPPERYVLLTKIKETTDKIETAMKLLRRKSFSCLRN